MVSRITSPIFLVILSSLVWSELFGTSFSIQQEVVFIKYGVYDCVDFYKQPAFNHPLLKNLSSKKIPNLAEIQGRSPGFGLEDGGCPIGTVPILRTNSNSSSIPSNEDVNCVAVVHTIDTTRNFYGLQARIGLYRPRVAYSQWSSARIKLINGNNNIEAGWMVNPDVFEDYEAHLYVKFSTGSQGCINLQCPGFVQVAKDLPLGIVPTNYSKVLELPWYWRLSIDKHQQIDENWWLSITDDNYLIGYWPKELFTTLADVANQVEWGGEVQTGPKQIQLPEMGTGAKATYDHTITASIMRIQINEDHIYKLPQNTKKVWNYENWYTVKDAGYKGEEIGRLILYGGPWDY